MKARELKELGVDQLKEKLAQLNLVIEESEI